MAFAWGESGPVGSPGEFLQPACRADPEQREREEEKMESGAFKTVQQLAKLFPHQNTEEHANVSEEGHSSRAAGSRAC